MSLNQLLIAEFEQESKSTKKILERVPFDNPGWKPHEKSMPLGRLATHIADLPKIIFAAVNLDEMDFVKSDYVPRVASSSSELISIFEENYVKGMNALKNADDDNLMKNFTLRRGERIIFTQPKIRAIRSYLNHIYHHRAQLGVYLRLLNVPLPSTYGPTADEPM